MSIDNLTKTGQQGEFLYLFTEVGFRRGRICISGRYLLVGSSITIDSVHQEQIYRVINKVGILRFRIS